MASFQRRVSLNEGRATAFIIHLAGEALGLKGVSVDEEGTYFTYLIKFFCIRCSDISNDVLLKFLIWILFVFPDCEIVCFVSQSPLFTKLGLS